MEIKIQLIRCPIDDPALAADQWNMPLDLITVGSAVNKNCFVEILDGTLLGLDGILTRLDSSASCIGFTYTALSSKSLERLARIAKSNGSFVIVGGQPAAASAESLIQEKFIDAICVGDGEPTMDILSTQLLKNKIDLALVPNILYKTDNLILHSPIQDTNVWTQQINDRTLGSLNPENYFINYPATNTLINMDGERATNIFSKRGCFRRCSFCARQDKRIRTRNPKLVADEIRQLVDLYHVDYILDTCDTWVSTHWGNDFALEIEKNNLGNIGMMVFADARDITIEVSNTMKLCGIKSVLLGIESGSERILTRNYKKISKVQIINAVDNLVKNGIRVSCSFVLGQLDEDDDSIYETIALTELLHTRPGVICYGNTIIPLRGSRLWDETFSKDKVWPSYITRALDYEMNLVRELFISQNKNISGGLDSLNQACKAILQPNFLPIKEYAR